MASDTDQAVGQRYALTAPFRSDGGVAWAAELPRELHALTDTNEVPYRSPLRLFEDGRELGPAHAEHETIRRAGRGRYSFWVRLVYFAASDNTDPNVNGRSYAVERAVLRPAAGHRVASDSEPPAWVAPASPLRCAVLGLGNRGLSLAKLAQSFPGVELVWLVDRSRDRIRQAVEILGGREVHASTEMLVPLADPSVDAVIIALPDHLHRAVAEPSFHAGKHVFLEKPIATTATDAEAIIAAWRRSERVLQLGYVLRQAPFYRAIRDLVRQGILGPVRVASLSDQLDARHGASFMRRWHAQSAQSGGLIVHKACHDLDLICWLLDGRPLLISSFGGLSTFAAPPPAPFCSQCGIRHECPYVDTGLHERRTAAEAADPTAHDLDRCVFRTDKDIIDNQVVAFELDNGTRGTFYLAMQGPLRSERRITLIGDFGRLDGVFEDACFTVTFNEPERKPLRWSLNGIAHGGHGGGDRVTMLEFLHACIGRGPAPITDPSDALRGLEFALAAERSRRERIIVGLRN